MKMEIIQSNDQDHAATTPTSKSAGSLAMPSPTPGLTLVEMRFGDPLMEYNDSLFCVENGGDIAQAFATAGDLAEGLTQLLMRQHQAANSGEIIFTGEIRALAFISDTVSALTRSAQRALSTADNHDGKGNAQ
ncbi:hypothetical protein [Pseudomonas capsici]|uniref:hypothetical protein n=1 Tax=Pseudomonas capsici TaxID=2810614 RepID=UPI0021F1FAB7|nr:hypothetical protein [Pseudomonas capsici]MCV4285900.1 hypothetical protein [Pseudomonas capsici]